MDKQLDLSRTLFELSQDDPEILPIMVQAGFAEIAKPLMLSTVGRVMTIPKGAAMRGIPLNDVLSLFRAKGYQIVPESGID